MTPTGLEFTLVSLPAFLFPLYYVLRGMRLALKYGGKMIGVRAGRKTAES
jgi:hypothetical protein